MKIALTKPDQLSIFTFLWAVASLFHLFAFFKSLLDNPFAWITGILALVLLFRPGSVSLFVGMLVFSIAKTILWLPDTPNHILFELVINLGILLAYVVTLFSTAGPDSGARFLAVDRRKFFQSFAPLARTGLIILYTFAVLAKLNWDFLNPVISCGTWWLNVIRGNGLMFIPGDRYAQYSAIYGTVIVEAAIPLLLLFPKTRWYGIVLGLGFHLFLSLDPHVGMLSFCALLFALFFLFTPTDFTDKFYLTYTRLRRGEPEVRRIVSFLSGLALVIVIFILSVARYDDPLKYAPFSFWYFYAMWLIITFFTVWLTEVWQYSQDGFFSVRGILNFIPAILILNGLCPYLGLKTETSFSMYSNLRTEGGISNHLFMPTSLQIIQWQQDLVEIVDTDNKRFKRISGMDINRQHLITYFEFQRIASTSRRDFYVTYIRGGQMHRLTVKNGISSNPAVTSPHPWILAKLVQFRPIDKGPCQCKH